MEHKYDIFPDHSNAFGGVLQIFLCNKGLAALEHENSDQQQQITELEEGNTKLQQQVTELEEGNTKLQQDNTDLVCG